MNVQSEENIQRPPGWLAAYPLEKYSSLHEVSAVGLLDWKISRPSMRLFIQFNYNLNTPLKKDPDAHLIFDIKDIQQPPSFPDSCFKIVKLQRWRIRLGDYDSYEDFFSSLNNSQRQTNKKAERKFNSYGCQVLWFKEWSKYVEDVYQLYTKVAHRHRDNWLYDLSFFHAIAAKQEYQLFSVWFNGKMIGAFLLLDEAPILHGFCCGLDYEHSTPSCTYTWANHEIIKYAFLNKYQIFDIGITADDCKKSIGFKPVEVRMDIYSKGLITRKLLQVASLFITAKLNSEGELKCQSRLFDSIAHRHEK